MCDQFCISISFPEKEKGRGRGSAGSHLSLLRARKKIRNRPPITGAGEIPAVAAVVGGSVPELD